MTLGFAIQSMDVKKKARGRRQAARVVKNVCVCVCVRSPAECVLGAARPAAAPLFGAAGRGARTHTIHFREGDRQTDRTDRTVGHDDDDDDDDHDGGVVGTKEEEAAPNRAVVVTRSERP